MSYICRNCLYKGDMVSIEGIPTCPDCGQDDTQDSLEYEIDRAEIMYAQEVE